MQSGQTLLRAAEELKILRTWIFTSIHSLTYIDKYIFNTYINAYTAGQFVSDV